MKTLASTGKIEFCFELDRAEDIPPWGEGEDSKLHWFGLTSGRYWISTPLGDALRYTEETNIHWGSCSPYVDYQVARIFEDLQFTLPHALEPVPSEIAAVVSDSAWFDRADRWIDGVDDGDERAKRRGLCCDAMDWYQDRSLDNMHLTNGPMFHFWRVGDTVSIRWEPTGKDPDVVWSIPQGQFSVGVQEFESAAYDFFDGLLGAMQERIANIELDGWHRSDCRLDIPLLVKEQQLRTDAVKRLRERRPATDWDSVRRMVDRASAAMRHTVPTVDSVPD